MTSLYYQCYGRHKIADMYDVYEREAYNYKRDKEEAIDFAMRCMMAMPDLKGVYYWWLMKGLNPGLKIKDLIIRINLQANLKGQAIDGMDEHDDREHRKMWAAIYYAHTVAMYKLVRELANILMKKK